MNSKIILFLVGLVIIIFLIDIITNKEKFATREDQMSAYLGQNAKDIVIKDIKSIVSKIDGTKLNIEVDDNSLSFPVDIAIKTNSTGKYLGIDNLGLSEGDNKFLWKLYRIENSNSLNLLLGDRSGFGQKLSNVNYPFYMVLGKEEDYKHLALHYNYGRVMPELKGNYDRQKWDLSPDVIPQNQLVIKNMYDSIVGPVSSGNRNADPDRIKINFNVNDEKLKNLLNMDTNVAESSSGSKCDTYIPKTALKSLCPGCDY